MLDQWVIEEIKRRRERERERERRNESAGLDLRYSRFTNSSSADEKYVRPPRLSYHGSGGCA
jgi:hypothetical protein